MVARRSLVAGIVGAVIALPIAATAWVYFGRTGTEVHVDFERGYEGSFVRGFHPRERAEGKYFRWTDGASSVVFRHLPARGTLTVEVRLKTIRPSESPLPDLAFTANGVTVHRARAFPGVASYRFELPSSSPRLELGIESDTFEAGGRRLGVQVLGVTVMLPARERASWLAPALSFGGASLLFLAAGLAAGLPALASGAGAVTVAFGLVSLLRFGPVPFTSYPSVVLVLAAGVLVLAVGLRKLLDRLRWLAPGDRALATATLSVLLVLELAAATYPTALRSDADFQANRMAELLAGNFYPTSVTQHQPPFRIPYPVSLYVVAAPLAKLGVDRVVALEIVTSLSGVLVSAVLLFLGWRCLDDFRAGLIAAVIYALVPMNALSFSAGNFTNLFAVSMLALAFALVVVSATTGNRKAIVAAGFAGFVALTAHFGLLVEGVVLFPLWLVSFWLVPVPARDRRLWLSVSVAASLAAAGVYYLGYLLLVTSQWARALSGAGARAGGASSPETSSEIALMLGQLGYVFLATSLLGSLSFVRRPLSDPLAAASSGWLLVTAAFFALDLTTPLQIRYWLQALPLFALFSGAYLSRALDRGTVGRVAAIGAIVYIGVTGLRTLFDTVLFAYHS